MKTLLHMCCAPCSIACIELLRGEGIEPTGFWFNPNIHPFTEYRARKNALVGYAKHIGLDLVLQGDYGLRPFIAGVSPDFDDRCGYCYRVRFEKTAQYAVQNGFEAFTTTLLISPYQDHERICTVASEVAQQYGVSFLYRDFRPYFRDGQQKARDLELYMQKYCGCIFSEEDRYKKKKKIRPAAQQAH
ncbi:MAG: epoxyqueuosine reductase QueH [Candidatus Fimivivens sp.]